jgi:hypothetical protein
MSVIGIDVVAIITLILLKKINRTFLIVQEMCEGKWMQVFSELTKTTTNCHQDCVYYKGLSMFVF